MTLRTKQQVAERITKLLAIIDKNDKTKVSALMRKNDMEQLLRMESELTAKAQAAAGFAPHPSITAEDIDNAKRAYLDDMERLAERVNKALKQSGYGFTFTTPTGPSSSLKMDGETVYTSLNDKGMIRITIPSATITPETEHGKTMLLGQAARLCGDIATLGTMEDALRTSSRRLTELAGLNKQHKAQ